MLGLGERDGRGEEGTPKKYLGGKKVQKGREDAESFTFFGK